MTKLLFMAFWALVMFVWVHSYMVVHWPHAGNAIFWVAFWLGIVILVVMTIARLRGNSTDEE